MVLHVKSSLPLRFLRLVVSHHCTFFINSLAHFWGSRPYTTENTARDNGVLAFFTWGEGYHNYHHLFQWDYRNGVRWWQWDPTKWLISVCTWLGLARALKRVPEFQIRKALVERQLQLAQETLGQCSDQGRLALLRQSLEIMGGVFWDLGEAPLKAASLILAGTAPGMLVWIPSNSGGASTPIMSTMSAPQSPPCATQRS